MTAAFSARAFSRKLNIAMVCDGVTDCLGGTMTSTKRFAEHLVALGHKVIFITGRSPHSPRDGAYGAIDVYRFRSVPAPYFDGELRLGLPTSREIGRILTAQNIDVVHILLPMPSGLAALKAARALGLQVVMHSHMQPENLFLNLKRFMPLRWLNRLFYRYANWFYRQADCVVFPTEFGRRLFAALPQGHETAVISNGVNGDIFKDIGPNGFSEKFNLAHDTRKLLYVGRLHPEKNLEVLIRALPEIRSEHADIHLVIVGSGHRHGKLQRLAADLNVADCVTFLGRISDEDVVRAFRACELFVTPSLAEMEGMAVLEAMACGKPLLVANAKDSASVQFVDGNGVLFDPGNPRDLALKANRLLADPALLRAMGARSLEVSQRYDIKTSVRALEALYYSLLAHSGKRVPGLDPGIMEPAFAQDHAAAKMPEAEAVRSG